MASVKKTVSRKSSPKAAAQRHSKKMTQRSEGALVHQQFTDSLATLEGYWNKAASGLKKQLDTLRSKQQKIALKQKSAKAKKGSKSNQAQAEKAATLKSELAHAREALAQAKLAISKYAELSKQIKQFENQWLEQITQAAPSSEPSSQSKKAKRGRPSSTKKAASADPTAPKKRGRPKKQVVEAEWEAEEALEMEKPAPKKRGRKPKADKARKGNVSPVVSEEVSFEEFEPEEMGSLFDAEEEENEAFFEDETDFAPAEEDEDFNN